MVQNHTNTKNFCERTYIKTYKIRYKRMVLHSTKGSYKGPASIQKIKNLETRNLYAEQITCELGQVKIYFQKSSVVGMIPLSLA